MESNAPRLEVMPDGDGTPGILVIVPLSADFELRLKHLVPAEDLFWSAKPAGWWVPSDHHEAVLQLVRDYFGYAQVIDPNLGKAHHFYGRDGAA